MHRANNVKIEGAIEIDLQPVSSLATAATTISVDNSHFHRLLMVLLLVIPILVT